MKYCFDPDFRLGILGGGQLGKMLCQAASEWHLHTAVLDPDPDAPARAICTRFVQGDFRKTDDVLRFAEGLDLLTVEIESVDVAALDQLAARGLAVHPAPQTLALIQDKGLQKEFLVQHGLPTSQFELLASSVEVRAAVAEGRRRLPFVQKLRCMGYDGRGVQRVANEAELDRLLEGPCLVEDWVDVRKEIAVIAARRASGEVQVFPAVEMVFHPTANLVELLRSPADLPPKLADEARELAMQTIEAFGLSGLLAVEMFLDAQDRLWINEVAPRPHNSGHHTLANSVTSQYEQHLRAILDLPLGATDALAHAAMVNLLGAEGYEGKPIYRGIEDCLRVPGCTLHIYGKPETRPFRKMGHATIVGQDPEAVLSAAQQVRKTVKVIA